MATEVMKRLINVDEYYKMAEVGILKPDERLELINGEIYTIGRLSSRHASILKKVTNYFMGLLADSVIVSTRHPVRIDSSNEPEPGISILKFREDYYSSAHPVPADVLVIMEIASSSLDFDRERRVPLYASCSIPEYWIIDIESKVIEVYTLPQGRNYLNRQVFNPGDGISSLGRSIEVKELLAPIL
ncbi:MAG: Uma2 family endonuclease [Imperialibacter sp.]|uniref:Uma2 family endonuclease n=1 Tax=Imperialibacter sp. TaxID=2038411 RepID=UPI0032EE7635